jgi:hypothetical protein
MIMTEVVIHIWMQSMWYECKTWVCKSIDKLADNLYVKYLFKSYNWKTNWLNLKCWIKLAVEPFGKCKRT